MVSWHLGVTRISLPLQFWALTFSTCFAEGLNQRNEAPTFSDERESKACDIFKDALKPRGWKAYKRGLENWSFIPGSLLKKYKAPVIFKKGTKGIHYVSGWSELADMLEEFDHDYAPTNLNPPQERPRRLSCDSSDDEFGDDNSLAEAINQRVSSEDGKQQEDSEPEEEGWIDDDDSMNDARVKQDETTITTTTPDNNSLSIALDSLKKCREELTWLQDNPEFHGADETEICRDIIRDTVASLYAQVSNYEGGANNNEN